MPSKTYLLHQQDMYTQQFERVQFPGRIAELRKVFDPLENWHSMFWVTQERQILFIPFMRADHLIRAFKWLIRRIEERSYPVGQLTNDQLDWTAKMCELAHYLHKEIGRRKSLPVPEWPDWIDELEDTVYEDLSWNEADPWDGFWHV